MICFVDGIIKQREGFNCLLKFNAKPIRELFEYRKYMLYEW
jgi:hypothetical protein